MRLNEIYYTSLMEQVELEQELFTKLMVYDFVESALIKEGVDSAVIEGKISSGIETIKKFIVDLWEKIKKALTDMIKYLLSRHKLARIMYNNTLNTAKKYYNDLKSSKRSFSIPFKELNVASGKTYIESVEEFRKNISDGIIDGISDSNIKTAEEVIKDHCQFNISKPSEINAYMTEKFIGEKINDINIDEIGCYINDLDLWINNISDIHSNISTQINKTKNIFKNLSNDIEDVQEQKDKIVALVPMLLTLNKECLSFILFGGKEANRILSQFNKIIESEDKGTEDTTTDEAASFEESMLSLIELDYFKESKDDDDEDEDDDKEKPIMEKKKSCKEGKEEPDDDDDDSEEDPEDEDIDEAVFHFGTDF